ncbi:MAG: DUF2723 domain-containing protein [Myxococcota bacterium]
MFVLAAGVPLVTYVVSASGHGYWLDSGEFLASYVSLGISHPPGHPLASLVGSGFTLLPFGSLAYRAALASAVLCAVATGFLFSATERSLYAIGVASMEVRFPLSLAASWTASLCSGWWLQGVRPEVYALQAALSFAILDQLVAFEVDWPNRSPRHLRIGAFLFGLALTNHHLLTLLLLPAIAPTLARVYQQLGVRPLLRLTGFAALGLIPYVYLPLRSLQDPLPDLGDPTSLQRFFWVISAEAFQKNQGALVPQNYVERLVDLVDLFGSSLGFFTMTAALLGAYVAMRIPSSRRLGVLWTMVVLSFATARVWLGFIRSNPDAAGYLMPAFGASSVLASLFAGQLLRWFGRASDPRSGLFTIGSACLLLLGAVVYRPSAEEAIAFAEFDAADAFDGPLRRDLPQDSVLILHSPQLVFRFWGGRAEERLRPDITLVPMPFLPYPNLVSSLVARDPDLRGLMRAYLLSGQLDLAEMQSLAARRPLFVEMDPRLPQETFASLVPDGLFYRVLTGAAAEADRRVGIRNQMKTLMRLNYLLGDPISERETRSQLLWRHYTNALFYASVGDRVASRDSVERGLQLNSVADELLRLRNALADDKTQGPLSIEAFSPEGAL